MPILSITVKSDKVKSLIAICNYYGTTLTGLLEGYIDYLIEGNRPIGFEFYDRKPSWKEAVKAYNKRILGSLDQ